MIARYDSHPLRCQKRRRGLSKRRWKRRYMVELARLIGRFRHANLDRQFKLDVPAQLDFDPGHAEALSLNVELADVGGPANPGDPEADNLDVKVLHAFTKVFRRNHIDVHDPAVMKRAVEDDFDAVTIGIALDAVHDELGRGGRSAIFAVEQDFNDPNYANFDAFCIAMVKSTIGRLIGEVRVRTRWSK